MHRCCISPTVLGANGPHVPGSQWRSCRTPAATAGAPPQNGSGSPTSPARDGVETGVEAGDQGREVCSFRQETGLDVDVCKP